MIKMKNINNMNNNEKEMENVSEKNGSTYVLLNFFLGFFGAHRFYAGKIGTGILMLLTFGGLGWWNLFDMIIGLTGNAKDKSGAILKPTVKNKDSISSKNRVTYTILSHYLGLMGGHRFYAGKIGTGILMLLTFGGFGIWWLIDFVMAVQGNATDKQGATISY